ncbi:uncharacterized protein LOC124805477 [Schistocerca piceifrons]|uniref:uncharacterized protein LOC124805477 n=1 Tax=Schistocerca piceifrons TaxID=274613 RepID=UPI001F5EF6C2|nr:uncharacterized protein LOC124805477 [Schistocerca piceifrons]
MGAQLLQALLAAEQSRGEERERAVAGSRGRGRGVCVGGAGGGLLSTPPHPAWRRRVGVAAQLAPTRLLRRPLAAVAAIAGGALRGRLSRADPCHYSCLACAGPGAGDCTRCHGDAEPRPSAQGAGRLFCWPRAAATADGLAAGRSEWWLLAGAVSMSASVVLLLALAAWWCASRRRLDATADAGRRRGVSRGRRATYVNYRRVGADDDDDDDDDYVRGKDAAVNLSTSESESEDTQYDAAGPRPPKMTANGAPP